MNFQEEYKLRCAVTNQNQSDILHIEVKCKSYQPQCYYKHLTFQELPTFLQSIFNNISHLFVYMNQPDMVYFDDNDASIKICIPIAGQIREFPIKMQSRNREEGLKHRIQQVKQVKARNQDDFNKMKQQKESEFQEMNKAIQKQKQEKQELQKKLEQIMQNTITIDSQICQLNLQVQYLVSLLKKSNENEQISENSLSVFTQISESYKTDNQFQSQIVNDLNKSEVQKKLRETSRKQFWIKEIGNLKKPKTLILKQLINPDTDFQSQNAVQINSIQLKKMLFVEVFSNLQYVNLSNNHIRSIEGLTKLKMLRKLDLSLNKIEAIKGLGNNINLDELILHSNKIRKIQNLFHLSSLRILSLSKNEIESVPDKISKLYKIVELKLGNNKINDVSEKVQLLKSLRVFTIVGNKCYSLLNKSKDIIDRLISRGIKTTE